MLPILATAGILVIGIAIVMLVATVHTKPTPGPIGLMIYDSAGRGYNEEQIAAIQRELEGRVDEYAAGWRAAAQWADRDDLIADIGSPRYESDKRDVLAKARAL